MNGTTIIQDFNAASLQPSTPIPKRLINWWRWYQQLTGMEDIEVAKQHVISVQDKLFKCQDERRLLTNQASLVADKLKEVYGELIQTKRDDPKYVQLTIMENKGLQEQSRIGAQLRLLENAERDHFTELATAIKEYHDSQAMNAQKYKYLSIVASAALAIISLCGSMVYNNRRIRDVRIVIADAQQKNEATFKECFESLEQRMKTDFSKISEQLSKNYAAVAQSAGDRLNEGESETSKDIVYENGDETDINAILSNKNIWIGTLMLLLYIYSRG